MTTARTPLVSWRRWPSRLRWPAAWDDQTPSALPARACGLAGRSPTGILGSVWHRRLLLQAVTHSVTQRRTTGARDMEEERQSHWGVRDTLRVCTVWRLMWLFLHQCFEAMGLFGWSYVNPKQQRTVPLETVVANSHRTLTKKVYFLTCTWW